MRITPLPVRNLSCPSWVQHPKPLVSWPQLARPQPCLPRPTALLMPWPISSSLNVPYAFFMPLHGLRSSSSSFQPKKYPPAIHHHTVTNTTFLPYHQGPLSSSYLWRLPELTWNSRCIKFPQHSIIIGRIKLSCSVSFFLLSLQFLSVREFD